MTNSPSSRIVRTVMQDENEVLRQAIRDRDKAQDWAAFWKWVSIVLTLIILWTVLELHGCIAVHPNSWGFS